MPCDFRFLSLSHSPISETLLGCLGPGVYGATNTVHSADYGPLVGKVNRICLIDRGFAVGVDCDLGSPQRDKLLRIRFSTQPSLPSLLAARSLLNSRAEFIPSFFPPAKRHRS
jgi:hypothetical protein